MYKEVNFGRVFIGRFEFGKDLFDSIKEFCKQKNISLGVFSIIGAVKKAKCGYYDQDSKKYVVCVNIEKKLEITSCIGNISMKDGEIFPHAHITWADLEGNVYGGHLMNGTEIFAAEFYIQELKGAQLKRQMDIETGLPLWVA